MPAIQHNISLQPYNSLALQAKAEYFSSVSELDELLEALAFARDQGLAVTALGGGSNIVLAGDIAGLVIQLNLCGVSHRLDSANNVVEVTWGAGENWHQQVLHSLEQGWYGLENLSLIPGTMGAAPIQNIGAYGVELADLFVSLRAVDLLSGEVVSFDRDQCQFGYRDSLFKQAGRDRYIIVDITLRLSTEPSLNTAYPALDAAVVGYCAEHHLPAAAVTPKMVSQLVCTIRQQKLPDPNLLPNAGSFFKNPLVASEQLATLLAQFPQMPHYPQADGSAKVPAAWLIEQSGLKGAVRGRVAVHDQQALVLVNRGDASGAELMALAAEVRDAVTQGFGVVLEIEPRVYGL